MSNGFAVETPSEYEASKPIDPSGDHRLQIRTQSSGRWHSIDCETHALGVGVGYARKVSDEAIKVFAGEWTNSQLRHPTNG
jgi:hypothetical protein